MLITNRNKRPIIPPIYLNNIALSEVQSHTNLGVTITNDLSWSKHITQIASKANKRLNIISRSRHILPRLALEHLYTSMVRPIIEYGDTLFDNAPLHLTQLLDKIQRRAAIICTGAYRHTENQALLRELAWEPLAARRKNHKLIIFYKIYHKIYPWYLYNLIPPPVTHKYPTRHQAEFQIPKTRLTKTKTSFFPSTTKLWNNLSTPNKNKPSVTSFKHFLSQSKIHKSLYNTLCTGKPGVWLTRLRLGLSALNQHRYKYNFINNPYCPHCLHTPETTSHFFFSCPKYNTARTTLLSS